MTEGVRVPGESRDREGVLRAARRGSDLIDGDRLRRIAEPVLAFGSQWHRGPWRIGMLHWALDVPLRIEPDGGWGVLGATANDGGYYGIVLSSRILGTKLHPLTQGHEGTHVILGVTLPDAAWCACTWLHSRDECEVWAVTPLTMISEDLATAFSRRDLTVGELSILCAAPLAAVRMRMAVHHFLHRASWRSRFLGELAQAQSDLQDWMVAEIAWLRSRQGQRLMNPIHWSA
jgi:hypothetical protein